MTRIIRRPESAASPRSAKGRFRRGMEVIEASLVLVLVIGLGLGFIEFGHYLFVLHSFHGAARAGARQAILKSATPTDIENAIEASLQPLNIPKGANGWQVDTDPDLADLSSAPGGANIKVRVYATWEKIGLRPLGIIPKSRTVAGIVVMQKEGA